MFVVGRMFQSDELYAQFEVFQMIHCHFDEYSSLIYIRLTSVLQYVRTIASRGHFKVSLSVLLRHDCIGCISAFCLVDFFFRQ